MAGATVEIKLTAIDELSGKIDQVKKKTQGLSNVGDSMINVGKSMAMMGGAIVAPFAAAVKTFADFEQKMKDVQVVSGATGKEFEMLQSAAKEIGKTTKFSATEAADGLYSLASAGLSAQEQVKTLGNVTSLAAATNSEFASTSATVVSTIKQYGMNFEESGRVADVFTSAIQGSMATLPKLSQSMKYAGSISSSLGMEMEDTTAYLMAFYDAGLKGEQAGTTLRGALARLMKPSRDASNALRKMGVSVDELKNSADPLGDALKALEKSGASTADIMEIFGQEAGPGVAALLKQGTASIEEYEKQLRNSAGTADKAAEQQMDTFAGMVKVLKSKLEGVAVDVGKAILPVVENIVSGVTKLIDAWNNVPKPIREATAKFTAISGIILTVGGGITALIGGVMKSIGVWKQFIPVVKTVGKKILGLNDNIAKTQTNFGKFRSALATGLKLAGIAALLGVINKLNGALAKMHAETLSEVEKLNSKMNNVVDTSKNWYEVTFDMIPLLGGLSDALHANRISNKMSQVVQATGEAAGEFTELNIKIRKAGEEKFGPLKQDMIEMAQETKAAGGMYKQFGTHVGQVKSQIVDLIVDMKEQGKAIGGVRDAWEGVIPGLDKAIEKEIKVREQTKKMTEELETSGEKGRELGEKIQTGIDKVSFEAVIDKTTKFSEDVTQIIADSGKMSKEEFENKFKEVDLSFLKEHATDTAGKLLNKFKSAGAGSAEALDAINDLGFDTVLETVNESAGLIKQYFVEKSKAAATSILGINNVEFSTLDEKIASISNSMLETLANAGIDAKYALEIINDTDFSGLKPTTEETKDKMIELFEKAGYSSKDAIEKVNEIDVAGLVRKSEGAAREVKEKYQEAAENTLKQFAKLNDYEFNKLQGEVNSFSTKHIIDELNAAESKANELDGKTVTINVRTKEVE